MEQNKMVDHLFRHQYGRMVSILTRIFGLKHLETIEDAVQDTFANAFLAWRNGLPDDPPAWLMRAAKNRVIDLFRKINADGTLIAKLENGPSSMVINDLFMDDEIADSQLRMIFTACHPALDARDQIAFALRTISGFSGEEIATALLLKPETIKKRLTRARKAISDMGIAFEIPQGKGLKERLNSVLQVLYLIFNEGFHSNQKGKVVRKELCGEAMRLTNMLRGHAVVNTPDVQALFALMCFHSARLESKVGEDDLLIDLKKQDRSQWHMPLIALGNQVMFEAVKTDRYSIYHFEAAIAAEHLKARDLESTDWSAILNWYERLEELEPSAFNQLNMAVVHIQNDQPEAAKAILDGLVPQELEQREYLFHGCKAYYHLHCGEREIAIACYDHAIALVNNNAERQYLTQKRDAITVDLTSRIKH